MVACDGCVGGRGWIVCADCCKELPETEGLEVAVRVCVSVVFFLSPRWFAVLNQEVVW